MLSQGPLVTTVRPARTAAENAATLSGSPFRWAYTRAQPRGLAAITGPCEKDRNTSVPTVAASCSPQDSSRRYRNTAPS